MKSAISLIMITLVFALCGISCFKDTGRGKTFDGDFCSGPVGGGHDIFANGVIDSVYDTFGIMLKNRTTNGSYENILLMAADDGKMGLVLEDTFKYAIKKGIADNNLALIAAAAKLKVFMVAFYSDVYILVNKGSGINSIGDLSGKKVSIAEENSGTYITARTILDTYSFAVPPVYNNDSTRTAVPRVVSGEYDALIKVTANPSAYFGELTAGDNVKFIRAELAGEKALYDHTGTIMASGFPFQSANIDNNIRVRVLLVGTPEFDDRDMASFLASLYAGKDSYAAKYTDIWNTVSVKESLNYFGESPYAWNLRCASYLTGINIAPNAITNLACGTVGGSTEKIAADIIPVIQSTLGLGLDILNTSGSPEMAINIVSGSAAMAIVVDDVFHYLNNLDTTYDSFTALNMRKVMPLFKEELHLLVNTSSGINTIADLAGKKVCLCEKTSGTFIVARNVLKTYGFTMVNAPIYYFESPATAVAKVANGTYDAIFKLSAQPYSLFQALPNDGTVKLIPVRTKEGTVSVEYETGTIIGSNYPFQNGVDITGNIYVRGMLVVSPALNDDAMGSLIQAIFDAKSGGSFTYPEYWSDVTPDMARNYFKSKPYGWSKQAAAYYLTGLGY